MFTLRGIFPAPQKECKKNFIKENVRQLRNMQNNRQPSRSVGVKKTKSPAKQPPKSTLTNKSSENYQKSEVSVPQSSERLSLNAATKSSETPIIRKADMNEYLRRKMMRDSKPLPTPGVEYYKQSTDNLSRHKDIGCQYTDPDATHFFADGTKLRIIYPSKKVLETLEIKNNIEKSQEVTNTSKYEKNSRKDEEKNSRFENKKKESCSSKIVQSRYLSNTNLNVQDTNRSTVSMQSPMKLDPNTSGDKANPLLPPATYQKGVVPKYIKEMKQKKGGQKSEKQQGAEQMADNLSDVDSQCPPGHMALPESERIETLKILKEKFTDLIDELNRMPVRTDTLRMKNRKMQLDKELSKLEEGIKVFSRPKVYVNIDI